MEVTANGQLPDLPVTGSVTELVPASPRPLRAGCTDFSALDSAPYRARKFARHFLDTCHGITKETAENAELLVSELVTNAYQAADVSIDPHATCSQCAEASVITLSLRQFHAELLIEVIDSSPQMPCRADSGTDAESGRGLLLTEVLSAEWGYFRVPHGGKCVYCILSASA